MEAEVNTASFNSRCKAVHVAALTGRLDIIEYHLEKGFDVNAADKDGWTPLMYAACEGRLNVIECLLKYDADIRARAVTLGVGAIHIAAANGNRNVVSFLLKMGEDINAPDNMNWTPLHHAAKEGELETVQFLVDNNADIYAKSNDLQPIHVAIQYGHKNVVEYFVSKDINNYERMEFFQLMRHAIIYNKLDVIKTLRHNITDTETMSRLDAELIHFAAAHGCKDIIEFLLFHETDIDKMDSQGWTPLHYAAKEGKVDIVEYLINRGANIGNFPLMKHTLPLISEHGCKRMLGFFFSEKAIVKGEIPRYLPFTINSTKDISHCPTYLSLINGDLDSNLVNAKPIHIAVQYHHKNVIELLLSKGVPIDQKSKDGYTALHFSAMKGDLEIAAFLLDKNADINSISSMGEKPIHIAAAHGHKNMVEFFSSRGVDIDDCNEKGWSALHYAAKNGQVEVIKFLLEKGANIYHKNYKRINPFNIAAYHGQMVVVRIFLEFGLNVNYRQADGNTALHEAAEKGHLDIVQYLIENGADIHIINSKGEKPIHIAAQYGNKDILECLILKDTNIDEVNNINGWTALHYAIQNLHLDIVQYLVINGANVKVMAKDGINPLGRAVKYRPERKRFCPAVDHELGETRQRDMLLNENILDLLLNIDGIIDDSSEGNLLLLKYAVHNSTNQGVSYIVKKLVEAGAKCDAQDSDGYTALHYAVEENNLKALQIMLTTKPNLDKQCNKGCTLLHLACKRYNPDVIILLLKAGAKPDIKDNDGRTVLYYYLLRYINGYIRDYAISEILQRVDDYINIDDRGRQTAAHIIVGGILDLKCCEMILKKQKDLNVEDANGNTPVNILIGKWCLSVLHDNRYLQLLRLFIQNGAYLKKMDCQRMISDTSTKKNQLKDVDLCTQSIVNEFNNKNLPMLYKVYTSIPLPPIERMKLNKNKIKKIEQAVEHEIKLKGYCYVSQAAPTLEMLAMKSFVSYIFSVIQ